MLQYFICHSLYVMLPLIKIVSMVVEQPEVFVFRLLMREDIGLCPL